MTPLDLRQNMEQRRFGAALIARVMRLNPNPREGERLRGIYLAPTYHSIRATRGLVSKKEFIQKFGRDAWSGLPKWCIEKHGKRAYCTREAVEDNIWMKR